MEAMPYRIEALPGTGRFALAFRLGDGSEQTAVVEVAGERVRVADAALPAGWGSDTESFRTLSAAVLALNAAREQVPVAQLRDVGGGWDVSLGNVVLDSSGAPSCTAHGAMRDGGAADGGTRYECADCGAAAILG